MKEKGIITLSIFFIGIIIISVLIIGGSFYVKKTFLTDQKTPIQAALPSQITPQPSPVLLTTPPASSSAVMFDTQPIGEYCALNPGFLFPPREEYFLAPNNQHYEEKCSLGKTKESCENLKILSTPVNQKAPKQDCTWVKYYKVPSSYQECMQIPDSFRIENSCDILYSVYNPSAKDCFAKGGMNPEVVDGPTGCELRFTNP